MRFFQTAVFFFASLFASQAFAETPTVGGEVLFIEYCASCHGVGAKGNGPAASGLKTPPPDLTKIAARRNGVWPMLEVISIIDGYMKLTNAREDMPVFADLNEGPTVDFDSGNGLVTPVSAKLVALVDYLESIQSPKPVRSVP